MAEYLKEKNDGNLAEIKYDLINPSYIKDLRKKYRNLILLLSSSKNN